MPATVIPTRFQLRRDTAANWTAKNPTPLAGEPCLETDTGLRKLGDGVTAWNSLLYQLSGAAYDFAALADGDTPIWDGANKRWNHGPGGKVYQAGVGIGIANPTTSTPTINSTLGSIALSGNPANYAALPTGLGAGDAGKAYLLQSDGLIYIWSGTAFPASGSGVALSVGQTLTNCIMVNDTKASGVQAGASVVGVNTRTLNTVVANGISGAALASNQLTLPAGTYHVKASAPGYITNNTRLYLYSVTGSATLILGTPSYMATGGSVFDITTLEGYITLAGSTVLELRQSASRAQTTNGLGVGAGDGQPEIYAQLIAWKVK